MQAATLNNKQHKQLLLNTTSSTANKSTARSRPQTQAKIMLSLGTFTVPTKGSKDGEEDPAKTKFIDTEHLNEDKLKTLKKEDPFSYYSIPTVRAATVRRGSIDMPSIQRGGGGVGGGSTAKQSHRRMSCPYRIDLTPTKIARRTCISFECHPDIFLDETVAEEENEDRDVMEVEEEEEDVDFDSLFDDLIRRQKEAQAKRRG